MKARGGYVTADVIDVNPETPGLEAMLSKFSREHWHDEDEVRFIISGNGLFHIRPKSTVVAIEVEAGDATSLVSPHVSEFREEPIWMTGFSLVAVCG